MSWLTQVGSLLKQYSSSGAAAAPAPDVQSHYDQVAQAAPASVIAEGLAAAFRSGQTPPFAQMLARLFTNSNADQKAGMLSRLFSSVNPSTLTSLLSAAGLSGLSTGPNPQVTPDQAQKVPPAVVQGVAEHAEQENPSIVDTLSSFYAQHTTLVKTLGETALAVALAKVAERQR